MVCVVRCRWKLPSYWMGGYLLCLLHLVLGCDLLPFLVVVSGVLFWALLLVDVKGLLFSSNVDQEDVVSRWVFWAFYD